jgi:OmpA-OmpF porin, OOP family
MKKLVLLFALFAFILNNNAQTEDKKWNIGLHGGAVQYNGDLGNDLYKTDMAFYPFGGLSLSRYVGKNFDLNLMVNKGVTGFNRESGIFNYNFTSALLNFRFNLFGPQYRFKTLRICRWWCYVV